MKLHRLLLLLPAALLLAAASPALAEGRRLALFPFDLVNTSMEPTRPDELARLEALRPLAEERLEAGGYELVDTAPVAAEAAKAAPLRDCNGCELRLAKELGADLVALGWVQKVSNLILNVNLQVREVATGRLVEAGSVDIRGNTDESWRRGVVYLVNRRILGQR